MRYRTGAQVTWKWGKGTGVGKIAKSFTENVQRRIEGALVKRKASPEKPAYLIRQENGHCVLKSHSEVKPAR